MAVVLFIDLLGARRRWHSGGVAEAMPAFYRFKRLVNTASRRAPAGEILDGLIETDAAMFVCRTAVEAARIGQRLYREAFASRFNHQASRDWYRGCIVAFPDGEFLRKGDVLREPVQTVTAFRYSEAALEAISVEKSGFKGMRLLIERELVDATTVAQMKILIRNTHAHPISNAQVQFLPAKGRGAIR